MVDIADVQVLVERAQAGDGGAFGELYEQFAEIFRFLLRRVNGDRETAEDLTEEVFLKALQRLGGYQFRGLPFGAWLYRIARNHLIDHLRSRPRQTTNSLDTTRSPATGAEQVMDRSLDRHELAFALGQLAGSAPGRVAALPGWAVHGRDRPDHGQDRRRGQEAPGARPGPARPDHRARASGRGRALDRRRKHRRPCTSAWRASSGMTNAMPSGRA